MTKEVARAFGRMSEKLNEMAYRIDTFYSELHNKNQADIEFLAMMSDVELEQGGDENGLQ